MSLRDAVAAPCAPTGFRDWSACAVALAPAVSSPSASPMTPKAIAPRTRHWRAEIARIAMPLRAHGRMTLNPHCSRESHCLKRTSHWLKCRIHLEGGMPWRASPMLLVAKWCASLLKGAPKRLTHPTRKPVASEGPRREPRGGENIAFNHLFTECYLVVITR